MVSLGRRLWFAGVLVSSAFVVGVAQAGEITFDFGGTVTSATVNAGGGFAQLPPGVAVGVPVSATVSYDTSTPGSTSMPNVLTYAGSGFTIDIAGNNWVGLSPEIFVGGPPTVPVHFITFADGAFSSQPPRPTIPFSDVNATFATLGLASSAANFLHDEQLPTGPLNLSLASSASGSIDAASCQGPCFNPNGPGDANYMIDFTIDSMTLANMAAIPEPSTVALLGAALLVFGGLHRLVRRWRPSATSRG